MAFQTDVQPLTVKTLLASDATWGAIRVNIGDASQAKTPGETFVTCVPEIIPDHNKAGKNIKLRSSFQASPRQYKW